MANRDSRSLAAIFAWKVLKHIPGRKHQVALTPSSQPQVIPWELPVQQEQHPCIGPETRHLTPEKRSLSLPFSCHSENVGEPQLIKQQNASLLFALPKELRLIIYENLLGGMVFHIVKRRTKLGHTLCKERGDPEQCILNLCRGYKIQSGVHTGRAHGELIQILQTCRRV